MIKAQELIHLFDGLPPSEDNQAAFAFLRQTDLVYIDPHQDFRPFRAKQALRTFRLRQQSVADAGIASFGFPDLLAALEKLSDALVTNVAFETSEWMGTFWLDEEANRWGFVLVQSRLPEDRVTAKG